MNMRRALVAMTVAAAASLPVAASAQTAYVEGTTTERTPGDAGDRGDVASTEASRGAAVAPSTLVRAAETLPLTGGDVAQLAIIGVALTGAGTVLVRRSRTAAAPAQA